MEQARPATVTRATSYRVFFYLGKALKRNDDRILATTRARAFCPLPSTRTPASQACPGAYSGHPGDDLPRRIHEGTYSERVCNPQTALAPAEHVAWASRTGAPNGKPALEALQAIHQALDDDRLSAAERVLATPWLIEAENILEAAGLLGGSPGLQPQLEFSGRVGAD